MGPHTASECVHADISDAICYSTFCSKETLTSENMIRGEKYDIIIQHFFMFMFMHSKAECLRDISPTLDSASLAASLLRVVTRSYANLTYEDLWADFGFRLPLQTITA